MVGALPQGRQGGRERMAICQHAQTFAGFPVRLYEPRKTPNAGAASQWVYRLTCSGHDKNEFAFPELLDRFLSEHGGDKLRALIVGAWDYEDMIESGRGSAEVVQALVAAQDRMPNLNHLLQGDIVCEECEISWIHHGDASPLLPAFPELREFRIRGAATLTFGKIAHEQIRSFAIESGGLPAALLEEVWKAKLPVLEHLELWLGDPDYGGISEPGALEPLLSGKLFPRLRCLGLRNCAIADTVAMAVAASPLLERLRVLDLSLGNLTDAGAEALLGSAAVRKLQKLDLHHHFVTTALLKPLEQLPIDVDVREQLEPDVSTRGGTTDVYRYIVASE